MDRITLYAPALNNAGGYIDAGTTVPISDNPTEISTTRAADLADGIRGIDPDAVPAESAGEDS